MTLKVRPEMLLSEEDGDLREFNWHNDGWGYLIRCVKVGGRQRNVFVHRVVLERVLGRALRKGEEVDHIDYNPANNRRDNLRLVTSSQNKINGSRLHRNNTSGLRGVSWHKAAQKWSAQIHKSGVKYHLGLFDTNESAHLAYLVAAREMYGDEYIGVTRADELLSST